MKPRILSHRILIPLAGVVAAGIILLIPAFQRAHESAQRKAETDAVIELFFTLKFYSSEHDNTWPASLQAPPFYSTLSPKLQALVKNPSLTYFRPAADATPETPLLRFAALDGNVEVGVSGTVSMQITWRTALPAVPTTKHPQ